MIEKAKADRVALFGFKEIPDYPLTYMGEYSQHLFCHKTDLIFYYTSACLQNSITSSLFHLQHERLRGYSSLYGYYSAGRQGHQFYNE